MTCAPGIRSKVVRVLLSAVKVMRRGSAAYTYTVIQPRNDLDNEGFGVFRAS